MTSSLQNTVLSKEFVFSVLLSAMMLLGTPSIASAVMVSEDGGGGGGGVGGGGVGGGGGGGVTLCNDGIDNDGNGRIDYPSDLGCTSAADTTEAGYVPPTQCGDGLDNDSNGLIDYPSDLGCTSAADTAESGYVTQCKDNVDNDANGLKDYPGDAGCTSIGDATEAGYTPPPVPPPGVLIYKTQSKRDYYGKSYVDQLANGGISETVAFGYPNQSSSIQAPSGTRVCSLYDPTSFITWWSTGGFDSPGNNSMAAWYPAEGKWKRSSAGSFGNRRYNWMECKTLAPPDTSLTGTANGVTGTSLSVASGTPVTLTWSSIYGQLRQGTMSAVNFDLTSTIAGHWETVSDLTCNDDGEEFENEPEYEVVQSGRSLMASHPAGCWFNTSTEWVPESTASRPFGGTKIVTPAQTTTYRYRGTNANGSSSSNVVVTVTDAAIVTTECSDGIDNDGNGRIDYPSDLGCTSAADTTESTTILPQCSDGENNDGANGTDYPADPSCTSTTDGTEDGVVTGNGTISCLVNGQSGPISVDVGTQATYTPSNPQGGAGAPYTWMPSAQTECTGGASNMCTFPGLGDYTMRLQATGVADPVNCPLVGTGCTGDPEIDLTASTDRVKAGEGLFTLDWEIDGVEEPTCSIVGIDGTGAQTYSHSITINACVAVDEGPVTVGPIDTSTNYTLTCGSETDTVIMNVDVEHDEF